ncbi:hypothetical protein HanIR_Chr05g0245901 [Helianthus annuus]|nr:hypothetical protein HanIR_Chr05g0245901 [Helianthus annuus]
MHQLRESLLLTEAVKAEAIQRPKDCEILKTEVTFASYCQGGVCWCMFCDNSLDLVFGYLVISKTING